MSDRAVTVRDVLAGTTSGRLADCARATTRLIVLAIVAANVVGAGVVIALLGAILPVPDAVRDGNGLAVPAGAGALSAAVYVVIAVAVGSTAGLRLARPVMTFYRSGEPPGEADRRAVLRLPALLLRLQAVLWAVGVLVFGAIALRTSALYGFEVAVTVALGGIPTACLAYLLTQRLLRLGVAAVLAETPPRRREVPGVRPRALLAWALGTVPVGGIAIMAALAPATDMTLDDFARAASVLSVVSVVVGALAVLSFARAVADPLQQLRDAFAHVEDGDFDVSVPVHDATEVGYATASFNRMAAGLREREKLRDLFGRQVGVDVARQALSEGVRLGGEERPAAALFVDIIGSTSFAADRPPQEVVEALNAFFAAVVGATQEHGGLVNKFIGDAALCIFGAPLARDDPAGHALAAARDIARRLQGNTLRAGIGVAYGTVVAGNVGTAERYEYTVIGDPVNEAARLTELAKERPGLLLASCEAVLAADPDEAAHWHEVGEVELRGRRQPTRLAAPREPAGG